MSILNLFKRAFLVSAMIVLTGAAGACGTSGSASEIRGSGDFVSYQSILQVAELSDTVLIGVVVRKSSFIAQEYQGRVLPFGYQSYLFRVERVLAKSEGPTIVAADSEIVIGLDSFDGSVRDSDSELSDELHKNVPVLREGDRIVIIGGMSWPQQRDLFIPVGGNAGVYRVVGENELRWEQDPNSTTSLDQLVIDVQPALGKIPVPFP